MLPFLKGRIDCTIIYQMKNNEIKHKSSGCPGRVVDILEACGAFDPGSSPGRGVIFFWA